MGEGAHEPTLPGFPPPAPPPAPPAPRKSRTNAVIIGAAAAVIVTVVTTGVVVVQATDDDNRPATTTTASSMPKDTAEPAVEEPEPEPTYAELDASDFTIEPRTTRRECFGSAGCNLTVEPELSYTGIDGIDPDAVYEISGDEDGPVVETAELSDQTTSNLTQSPVSTASASTEVSAEVTDVVAATTDGYAGGQRRCKPSRAGQVGPAARTQSVTGMHRSKLYSAVHSVTLGTTPDPRTSWKTDTTASSASSRITFRFGREAFAPEPSAREVKRAALYSLIRQPIPMIPASRADTLK